MTWPMERLPVIVRAILLLPAGMRAFDEDFPVTYPPPQTIHDGAARYELMSRHYGGTDEGRVLYVLGGRYLPHGAGHPQLAPDEAHDQ